MRPGSDIVLINTRKTSSGMGEHPQDVELYVKILSFLSKETRTRKQLSQSTDVFRDLGIDGDDARELLARFRSEFEVDMTTFDFGLHFGSEGFELIKFVRSCLGGSITKAPITTGLLYE